MIRWLVLCVCCEVISVPAAGQEAPSIVSVRKIWDHAPHNAFTDLIRFRNRWMCVFREGRSHVSPDGAIRVISSDDGAHWESAALIRIPDSDLRDAKITVTPDHRLMLSGAGARDEPGKAQHQSLVWFSDDGRVWSQPREIADRDYWLWRITWHNDRAWGFGYGTRGDNRGLRLYSSNDGKSFQTIVNDALVGGYPNETSMVFADDGTCYCLLRRDGDANSAQLGISRPPWRQWQWKDLGIRIGGPDMIQVRDGMLLAAVRLYDGGARTALCRVDGDAGTLTEILRLPSGGDTSYAGMVWHEDQLWLSYYSSHEGKASIYLAQVELDGRRGATPDDRPER